MPDFSIVAPLAETIDRRGASYNLGLGDANLSPLGAAVEGFTKGAAAWTEIRTAQLEAQAKFDPQKLIADQVKRDLDNQRLDALIRDAEIDINIKKEFGREKELAGIRATQASTVETQSVTRTREAQLPEVIAESKVAARSAEELGDLKLRSERQKVQLEEDLGYEKRLAEIEELRSRGLRTSATGSIAQEKLTFEREKYRNEQIDALKGTGGKFRDPALANLQEQMRQAGIDNDPEALAAAQSALDTTFTQSFNISPPEGLAQPTRESIQQDTTQSQIGQMRTDVQSINRLKQEGEIRRLGAQINQEKNDALTDNLVGTTASSEAAAARRAVAAEKDKLSLLKKKLRYLCT